MKYCQKCGAKMDDDALFCPKCGTKVSEIVEDEPKKEEQPVVAEEVTEKKQTKKAAATPLYDQKMMEIIPMPIAVIVCSIVMWIITVTLHPTGIMHIMPLLLFMLFCVLYCVMNMVRAIKCLIRKMFLKAVLSFVFFGLLFTCLIINFAFLVAF